MRIELSAAERCALQARLDGLYRPPAEDEFALYWGEHLLGHVPPANAALLPELLPGVSLQAGAFMLPADWPIPVLQTALNELARALRAHGRAPAWRNEPFDLRPWAQLQQGLPADGPGLVRLERGVFRPLGLQSRAVHLNGVLADGRMWIGQRAASKAVDPLRLDNLVGGGIAAGESPAQCLLRECDEEAGIPPAWVTQARPTGWLHARHPEFDGIHDELLCVFELRLPEDFVPFNRDGEVAGFVCLQPHELVERLLDDVFTVDAAAVAAHWLLRQAGQVTGFPPRNPPPAAARG